MSSSFKRMLAFLLASAACWSLALTIVSIHWWHFFNSSCNSNKLLHSCKYLNQFSISPNMACISNKSMKKIKFIFLPYQQWWQYISCTRYLKGTGSLPSQYTAPPLRDPENLGITEWAEFGKYVKHHMQRFYLVVVCTFRKAAMSGVIFRLSAASTSALACTKSWTTSKWPPFAANQRGVFPFLFRTSMCAPLQKQQEVIKGSSVPVILLWLTALTCW